MARARSECKYPARYLAFSTEKNDYVTNGLFFCLHITACCTMVFVFLRKRVRQVVADVTRLRFMAGARFECKYLARYLAFSTEKNDYVTNGLFFCLLYYGLCFPSEARPPSGSGRY